MALCSEEMFPTKMSFVIFVSYMALFINQGILVTASQSSSGSKYKFNTVTVVLMTECLKLIVAAILYRKDHNFMQMVADIKQHKKVLMFYFVPAALYCLYNNLAFVNLANYDPTTYFLLLQFRVVVTGVIFQLVFKKQLTKSQWFSLLFLTFGCIIKEYGHSWKNKAGADTQGWSLYFNQHLLFILVQIFASCFAGVYNEFLLKDKGADVHIMIQNIFMYIDSIICNVVALLLQNELSSAFTPAALTALMQPSVIALMLNNAAVGIVTSLFLRSLNSILKTFASALELMFTAVLCWLLFNISIDIFTIVAIFIVSAATLLYAQKPVVNLPKDQQVSNKNGKNSSNV